MREILFRARRIDNGKWVCGTPFQEYNNFWGDWLWIIQTKHPLTNVPYMHLEVDGKTISEFTGLLDKNGKEIFEGDVMNNAGNVVEFCNGGFCINGDSDLAFWTKTEVIGNIHDNPELR